MRQTISQRYLPCHATIEAMQETKILILGGGFGGIRTALDLSKKKLPNTKIVLISDKHHFEYTPALYKLATGRSPLETCIPLSEIFNRTGVEYLVDEISGGDLEEQVILGKSGSRYTYNHLVLALGSEVAYFGIPGVEEHSFSIKSVESSLRLKRHIHELFDTHIGLSKGDLISQFQFVIVGGGAAGVELAGEIRKYVRALADKHEVPKKLVTVDILQAGERLLSNMPEKVSSIAEERLSDLGVNLVMGHPVVSQDLKGVYLKDIAFNAKTIVWTAGVKPSSVYQNFKGLSLSKGGKVEVDDHLESRGSANVFAIGDGAQTPFSGTAQTALYDGSYVARVISARMQEKDLPCYKPRQTPYVVPIGPGWAIFTYKNLALSGRIFWLLRQIIDLRFFLSILPFRKALTAWREGGTLCESCPTCQK